MNKKPLGPILLDKKKDVSLEKDEYSFVLDEL